MIVYDIDSTQVNFKLPDALYTVKCGRGDNKWEILELFSGFDIETTNIYQLDIGWAAYAYHMQLSIYNQREEYVYLFRDWDILIWFLDHIIEVYDLGERRRMICFIANMSFEFQFLKDRLQWSEGEYDFFAKEERQPLKATYNGIEFHEALAISGGNLAHLAKSYCKTQKLVGDLDYSIERNMHTTLTDQERQYCINDVAILAEFSQHMFNTYIRAKKKVPLTRTSMIIEEITKTFTDMCKARDESLHLPAQQSELEYRDYLRDCFPDKSTYEFWFRYLFRGGYVHANALYCNIDIFARMKDETSAYPAQMNLKYAPVTPFKTVDRHDLDKHLKKSCCIIHCIFDYIEITTLHSIESKNKIISEIGGEYDNGRLIRATQLEVVLTELDFDIYDRFMTWQGKCSSGDHGVTILSLQVAKRGKFPPFLLNTLNRYYRRKNELKKLGLGDTQEYAVTKEGVNTFYGACVKRIKLDAIKYRDGRWVHDTVTPDFDKERDKSILLPQHGIWVTAHARHALLTVLHKLTCAGVDVIYMDTDSIKHRPKHIANVIFKRYNAHIHRHLHNRGLTDEAFADLGMFDDEEHGNIVQFKTLGAKRYIYYNGEKIKATIAGMPKTSIKALGTTPQEVFDNFNTFGFCLEPEESHKLTTKYQDSPHHANVAGETMYELSSVALYSIPFTLTIKDEFCTYIERKSKERSNL